MFLEQQISILEWFWRSCDTEDWSNDAENTALITGINYILQYITQKTVVLNGNNILEFYCILNKQMQSCGAEEAQKH